MKANHGERGQTEDSITVCLTLSKFPINDSIADEFMYKSVIVKALNDLNEAVVNMSL